MKEFLKRLWSSPSYQCALFSIAAILAVSFMGYHFGTFDQSIHIPFLKKFSDPSLYPNDHFLDLRFTHYSFFWFLFIPFLRLGILEISMFITYVFVVYLTFFAIWKLSRTLFNNPLVSLLSVIVFILPHLGFGLLTLIEFSLLNRTFVLPFLLLAIDAYLNKKYIRAFFILGIFYNFHVLSANFVLAMFLFDTMFRFKKIGWKKIVSGLVIFFITALPVLIWKAKTSPLDLTIRPEWYSIIRRGFLNHLFTFFSSDPKFFLLTLGGIGTVLLFYIGYRFGPKSELDRIVKNFVIAALIIIAFEFITATWFPITIIIQSQIVRVSIFFVLFGYLYFIHFLVFTYLKKGKEMQERFILLYIITLISGSPITVPVIWFVQQRFSSLWLLRAFTFFAIMAFVGVLVLASVLGIWSPGIYIFSKHDANYDVQIWAKNHTPKNALFITPPYPWLFYDTEWRVISERSTLAHLGELGEAAFAPNYLSYWTPRFEALAPGALAKFKGDIFENKNIIRGVFYNLTAEDIKKVAKKYGATYLVVEKPHAYAFPELYENSVYRVYAIIN